MTNNTYFIATGETDRLRLEILNKIYNPVTLQFLKNAGLKRGMKVLEFGCGIGVIACELAKQVGPSGKVIAVDNSASQLEIAHEQAKKSGVNNIEFHLCDAENIASLNETFDFCYGRWVLEFTKNPAEALKGIYQSLKPNGIFTYEAASMLENGHFSYPELELLHQRYALLIKNFTSLGLDVNFGHKVFHLLNQFGAKKVIVKAHQPILITAEEKSVPRLGLISMKESIVQRNIASEQEIDQMIQGFAEIETTDIIIGFLRNLLISGIKAG